MLNNPSVIKRVFTVSLLTGLVACGDDSTAPIDPGSAPDLPPLTSMTGDFSFFGSPNAQLGEDPSAGNLTALNFTNAAIRVVAAQVVTVVGLAVPVATFAAAANSTPTFEDDDRWHWRFTAVQDGQTYMAHLSGFVQGNDVVWDMRITSPTHTPPLDEFVWYAGQGRVDRTSGSWTFSDPITPSTSAALLRIDWTHGSQTDHGWMATALGGPGSGDVFSATVDGDDRLITYNDASEQTLVEIYWSSADGSGCLITPNYNGGVKACWDASQQDVACS